MLLELVVFFNFTEVVDSINITLAYKIDRVKENINIMNINLGKIFIS
jgi:hypothetical protein